MRKVPHDSGVDIFSFDNVILKNWVIKASASSVDSILIVMRNIKTGEVITDFFTDEVKANDFINYYVQL